MQLYERPRYSKHELRRVMKTDVTTGRPSNQYGFSLLPVPVTQEWEAEPFSLLAVILYAKERRPQQLRTLIEAAVQEGMLRQIEPLHFEGIGLWRRVGTLGSLPSDRMTTKLTIHTPYTKEQK